MPEVIPPSLILQQFNKKFLSGLLFVLRVILVGVIWIVLLPYFTVWIWRLYFFLGDNISKKIFILQQIKRQLNMTTNNFNLTSILVTVINDNTTTVNWLEQYKSRLTMQ